MNRNQIFSQTRWRLAIWYAGVMGIILSLSGVAIYYIMSQVHGFGLHQELESIAGTLHDSLEPNLQQPGRVEPEAVKALPGLCVVSTACNEQVDSSDRHVLGVVQREGYYVRLLDFSGQIVATLGYSPAGLTTNGQTRWQTVSDQLGNRYHQISLPLHTSSHRGWGYVQVGRSLKEFDTHLRSIRWTLLVGLPVIFLLIILASWWLAGLAIRPIYQSYQQMQQFTADAAHELRTPLAAIRATVQAVLRIPNISETESRNTLQTIERQNGRLSQLVQDLLLLSRMDAQASVTKQQSCCLNDLISDVVEEFAALALDHNVLLTQYIQINKRLYISGDEEQLYRLLTNLVTNAIQYTPPNGQVTVILDQDEQQARIHVQDNGIGIAAADQSRIFDRFYRVNRDRSRHTGGAGLGLAIAQAIAQAHQGNIQVQSSLDRGSRFTVRLPLNAAQSVGASKLA
jgi:signal transduction histidine kinase